MLKCATATAPVGGPELALLGDAICVLLISGPGPSWATPYDGLHWVFSACDAIQETYLLP